MMRRIAPWILMTMMTMTLALNACEGEGPGGDAPPGGTEAIQSVKLAQLDLGEGRKFAILGLQDGSFLYTQAGPHAAQPVMIPRHIVDEGGPIAVFKRLAPKVSIPSALIDASRGLRLPGSPSGPATQVAPAAAMHSDGAEAITQALSSGDWTGEGMTHYASGAIGCSFPSFFQIEKVGDFPFCPTGANSVCLASRQWAFTESQNVYSSYGSICVDQVIGQLNVTIGTELNTWYEAPGYWRMVVHVGHSSCGWWSCTPQRSYEKYDLVNWGPGTSSHIGAHFD